MSQTHLKHHQISESSKRHELNYLCTRAANVAHNPSIIISTSHPNVTNSIIYTRTSQSHLFTPFIYTHTYTIYLHPHITPTHTPFSYTHTHTPTHTNTPLHHLFTPARHEVIYLHHLFTQFIYTHPFTYTGSKCGAQHLAVHVRWRGSNMSAKEPQCFLKEPQFSAKELHISVKEQYISSEELSWRSTIGGEV